MLCILRHKDSCAGGQLRVELIWPEVVLDIIGSSPIISKISGPHSTNCSQLSLCCGWISHLLQLCPAPHGGHPLRVCAGKE